MQTSRTRIGMVAAVVVVVGVAVGLWWFTPWKLVVDETVNEAIPTVTGAVSAEPVVLASGEFVSHEHDTSGRVVLLELPDGQRVLRLEDLSTSNGPLLKVFLTDAPVLPGSEGWHVFDDGRYLDLGPLAGNLGSSNYAIPPGADLMGLHSVSIWCDRFDVSFGATELVPVGAM